MKELKLIEIARSYSRKKNLGNYETMDFFCSAKQECEEKEMSEISAKLFLFCQETVEGDIADYENSNGEAKKEDFLKVGTKWQNKEEQETTDNLGDDLKAEQ